MNRWHSLPAEVYALVERTPAAVLLECGRPGVASSEAWTQLFLAPLRICIASTAVEFSKLFAEVEGAIAAGYTAAGFFTYECGACFEPKATMHPPGAGQPLAWLGIFERSYRFDHATGRFLDGAPAELKSALQAPKSGSRQDSSGPDFSRFSDRLTSKGAPAPAQKIDAHFTLAESDYAQRIAAIHEWIRAGDVYQLNFTAPFSVEAHCSPAELYAHLRSRQPVKYGAFLHWQAGRYILSFSPELFFRIDEEAGGRPITTRPMKGTVARGRTTAEDRQRAEWLRNDPKNRAENLMIVDLLRNDLGRLAKFGTVRTEDLFAVERYSTLWQMTSTIKADLRPEVRFYDIFRALFPCGSITGAPKVRAMQLLAHLEEEPRGVYTGAIGYFSEQRSMFNVAIRTLELEDGHGIMGVGSGIVIDSNASQEYRECLLKAEFLTPALPRSQESLARPGEFSLIETMLWHGGFPLLELHLDRLIDSAEYFAFPCDRVAVKATLEEHARRFVDRAPRKVRLLLDCEGSLQISDDILPTSNAVQQSALVGISCARVDSADKWLYHKTTNRGSYVQALAEASRTGHDDVLFFNQSGELTEGAISNVFVEKDGRLLTPPIECGLLPGVYRRHLLETRSEIEERILSEDDLRTADAVYITNAVRGLRKVEIDWESRACSRPKIPK